CVIALSRIDPTATGVRAFLLPEGRPGLEIIHDELTGSKGVAAMRAADDNQHDLFARHEVSDTVDHAYTKQPPAFAGLEDDLVQGFFSHPRIVLQRHVGDAATVIVVAHQTDKAGHGTSGKLACSQSAHFCAEIEIGFLNAYAGFHFKIGRASCREGG